MTDFKIQEGQIFIHKNTKHEGQKPVLKGSLMIDGVEYDIALWGSKSGKDGSYSGKVKVKQDGPKPEKSPETHKGFNNQGDIPDDMDQNIPF